MTISIASASLYPAAFSASNSASPTWSRAFVTATAKRASAFGSTFKTIAFADFVGSRQYVTIGNLADNPKAHLFLIDYAQRHRIKIWGEARVVEGGAELIAKLMPRHYKARAGQVILFTVSAWDASCPQRIPQRFDAADVAAALAERDARMAALEAKIRALQQPTEDAQSPETDRAATAADRQSSLNST
jgi:hypothetical protein